MHKHKFKHFKLRVKESGRGAGQSWHILFWLVKLKINV